jgi:ABC-2 type transport system permease protein
VQLVPVVGIALLAAPYNLLPPASTGGLLACLLTLVTAWLLSCAITCITYGLLLNIHWGQGPVTILLLAIDLLSGAMVPLQLWPGWMQLFLSLQPFAGLADLPLRLYTGTMAPELVWPSVALQLVWILVFIQAGRMMISRSLKHIVIQGG